MAIWKWYWSEISVAVLTCSEYIKTGNWQSDLRTSVILVMHTKMHVFERPQTSNLISSCAIQYYMLWNLITLQIKIHYWVSCEKKQVHKRTCVLGCTLRLSVELTDQYVTLLISVKVGLLGFC